MYEVLENVPFAIRASLTFSIPLAYTRACDCGVQVFIGVGISSFINYLIIYFKSNRSSGDKKKKKEKAQLAVMIDRKNDTFSKLPFIRT